MTSVPCLTKNLCIYNESIELISDDLSLLCANAVDNIPPCCPSRGAISRMRTAVSQLV